VVITTFAVVAGTVSMLASSQPVRTWIPGGRRGDSGAAMPGFGHG
jgi:hypothetical protein